MRYEFLAFVIVEDDAITDATQAREFAEHELREVNKNPDGPHVYLSANAPIEEES